MSKKRKTEEALQNKSVGTCYLSAEHGALLDSLTQNGVEIPYAYFMRRALSLLPAEADQVKAPVTALAYPYRLGSSLVTADQKKRLESYMLLTGRSRSQSIRDAVQLLIDSLNVVKEVEPVEISESLPLTTAPSN